MASDSEAGAVRPDGTTLIVRGGKLLMNLDNDALVYDTSEGKITLDFDKVQNKLIADQPIKLVEGQTNTRVKLLYDSLISDNSESTIYVRSGSEGLYLYVRDVLWDGPNSSKGTLKDLIPVQAGTPTLTNTLVDYDTLMDAISSNLGTFRGTFDSEGALEAAWPYSDSESPFKNDYAFVTVQTSEYAYYDRYKCVDSVTGPNWEFEFRIATSGFTAAQWKALNSLATKEELVDLRAHIAGVVQQATQNNLEAYKIKHDGKGHITQSVLYHPDWNVNDDVAVGSGNSTHVLNRPNVRKDATTATGVIIGSIDGATINRATGAFSVAEGVQTTASALGTHAEGGYTNATYQGAHAEGGYTTASGEASHAEGGGTIASGFYSHAEGGETQATAEDAHAEGGNTVASALAAHAEGVHTTASAEYAHAEGLYTSASSMSTHAEGSYSIASGTTSHAEGQYTRAIGNYSHAEGVGSNTDPSFSASGETSHTEGYKTKTTSAGTYGHAEGYTTAVSGVAGHAEGYYTVASGQASHAEGEGSSTRLVEASGRASHAEGYQTVASQRSAHAEGERTTASGLYSHAEGNSTVASGQYSHAENNTATASGTASHAEGTYTVSSGSSSHTEGHQTTASG